MAETKVVGVRLDASRMAKLDHHRGTMSRTDFLRHLLDEYTSKAIGTGTTTTAGTPAVVRIHPPAPVARRVQVVHSEDRPTFFKEPKGKR